MKVTLKTLKKEQLALDVEEDDTIAAVKEKIQKEYGHEPSWQKLIFAGSILKDEDTVKSSKITENDFLVLMVRKPKNAPAKPAAASGSSSTPTTASESSSASSASTSSSTPSGSESPVMSSTNSNTSTTAAASTSTETSTTASAQPAEPTTTESLGGANETAIQNICDMGFPRDQVEAALRAAFGDPNRAVEYLMTGIPPQLMGGAPAPTPAAPSSGVSATPATPATPAAQGDSPASGNLFQMAADAARQNQQQGVGGGTGTSAEGAGGDANPFEFLRQHPQFQALRALVQQNPAMLQPVLQSLASANPSFMQLVQQHQQEFMQLLNEPVSEEERQQAQAGLAQMQMMQQMQGGMGGMGGMGPGGGVISVTPEEKEAIDRLEGLGFDRSAVIQAFIACDKDEQLAANYLLEHGYELMEDDEVPASGGDGNGNDDAGGN